jgi:hypothetical protein
MLKRTFIRILLSVALFCASFAWSGWAYLHTAADPHRVEVISTAVLANPQARQEIAAPLADQIVRQANIAGVDAPAIHDAVVATMADPQITANIIAAFGSAQSKAFGVPDPRPTTIDGTALVTAVRDKIATANPELAARIPIDSIGSIHLPEVQIPYTTALRHLAENCTSWLATIAIGLIALCLVLGDRKHVLRRYGTWAIIAGALWVIGPRIIMLGAHRWAHPVDAIISTAVSAASKPLTVAASLLVASGIGALVLRQFVWLGQALPGPASEIDASTLPAPRTRRSGRGASRVFGAPVAGAWLTPRHHIDEPELQMQPTATVLVQQNGANRSVWEASTVMTAPPEVELDPWAHFSGPAPAVGVAIPRSFATNGPDA